MRSRLLKGAESAADDTAMIAATQTVGTFALTGLIISLAFATLIAFLSAGRDWRAWRHPRRTGLIPMADSPATWFAITVFALPPGLLAYLLDRRHAPLKD